MAEQGCSVIFVGVDGALAGLITYHDPARAESAGVARWLLAHSVREIHLVTGGAPAAAEALAYRLGIAQVHAGALPDDKTAVVQALRRRGRVVAMVDDGLDGAPALVAADVSISLAHGANVARQPADVWRFGPLLGEDTDYVLRKVLGLSSAEVRAYAERGVLE